MVVIEMLVALTIAAAFLTGVVKIGGPLAEAFADKLKQKYREIGPEEERQLKSRIERLEDEVRSLTQRVTGIQETADFAVKMLETHKAEREQQSITLKVEKEQGQKD